ncbi:MAG: glycosyltransferase [Planctomycetales bacterium]
MLLLGWICFFVGWGCSLIWLAYLVPAYRYLRTHWLQEVSDRLPHPINDPFLSVIVPARNEAPQIEAGLKSLLASDYPRLEIIAVNDRSTDGTGETMHRVASSDSRLRVLEIQELPSDWLGKNHAMQRGAELARGELILFTDGDVIFDPTALSRAVRVFLAEDLDHLALFPRMIPGSYLETAFVCFFGMLFMMGTRSSQVRGPSLKAYAGVGAFNLVKANSYRTCGGHEPLRLEVLDDVMLGKMMKHSGFRQDVLLAGTLVQVRWQHSVWGVVQGLEKNAFASVQFSYLKLIAALSFLFLLTFLPLLGSLFCPVGAASGFYAALAVMLLGYGYVCYRLTGKWRYAPAVWIASLLFQGAYIRSCWITFRRGGVRWRETFYPLALLRANVYRGRD